MKLLPALIAPVALVLAFGGPAFAQESDAQEAGVEAVFVQCVYDKDPDLARAIQDAPSQEAFVEALEKASLLCDAQIDGMSLGRLFTKLGELLDAAKSEEEAGE